MQITTVEELLKHGFMPLDVRLFAKKTGTDLFESVQLTGGHTLIDLDYAIALLPRPSGMGSFGLDRAMLERFQQVDDHFKMFPSAIFSVGAIRGHFALEGTVPQPPEVLELDVSSRDEVEDIIERVKDKIRPYPLELWFRGQTKDYLVADLRRLANKNVCSWRHVRDTSLVPKLYRDAWSGITNLKEYCRQLYELKMYVLFMKDRLAMTPFVARQPDEYHIEKLSPAWGAYFGGINATQPDGQGNIVERHNYHQAFIGLQQSFFLQHYGLPSNILDITYDVDIGLFFAQNDTKSDGTMVSVDYSRQDPVLYVFLLMPQLDRFINSRQLSEHYHMERPIRQKCGLLCGASFISRNFYARYIALKLHLRAPISYSERLTPDYVFPGRDTDPFLDDLLNFQERSGITKLRPFVLSSIEKPS